jgi:hypothetical protein
LSKSENAGKAKTEGRKLRNECLFLPENEERLIFDVRRDVLLKALIIKGFVNAFKVLNEDTSISFA